MTEERPTEAVDWDEGEDVVVRHQRAIRVYLNKYDDVVVAQESGDPMDDDYPAVFIKREYVRAVIAALIRVAGLGPEAAD